LSNEEKALFLHETKDKTMLGAIIGDIVGSTREWHNVKSEEFELLPEGSRFTDDTVMTLAVARWLMDNPGHTPDGLVSIMQELGRKYPRAGYGGMFRKWLMSDRPRPYNSFGNGSAMRVSPVGMYARSLDEALELARISASVTHDHPEGIKGAQAIAACVFLQRNVHNTPSDIKRYVEKTFGYNLDQKLEDLREAYTFDSTCQGSVPIAIMAFLQRNNALDTLRLAISMGGDSDTIGCMATAIAYTAPLHCASSCINIPEGVIARCRQLLTNDLLAINDRFEAFVSRPLYQSFYLQTDNVYAGEYPGDKNGETVKAKPDRRRRTDPLRTPAPRGHHLHAVPHPRLQRAAQHRRCPSSDRPHTPALQAQRRRHLYPLLGRRGPYGNHRGLLPRQLLFRRDDEEPARLFRRDAQIGVSAHTRHLGTGTVYQKVCRKQGRMAAEPKLSI